MLPKLYQLQVLAGTLLAAVLESLVLISPPWLTNSTLEALEGGSFLLCCVGIIAGGREVRLMFESKGRDRTAAKSDPTFMRARTRVQITSSIALAALGVLAARRWGISWMYPTAGAAVFGLSLPIINRLSGWGPAN